MKIKIISVTNSDKHFEKPINEYLKRFWKDIELLNIKPEKNWERSKIIQKETEKIYEKLKKDDNLKVLLSLDGKNLSTENFCKNIFSKSKLTFIIWWPFWLDENILKTLIDKKVCLWEFTIPHWLAKLVLLEQLFRCKSIYEGKNYHY